MNKKQAWILIFPFSQVLMFAGFLSGLRLPGNRLPVVMFFVSMGLCICADIGLFFVYKKLRGYNLLEQKNKRMEDLLNLQRQHYDGLVDSIARQKKIQHDYINQIQAIYTLLSDQHYDEAKAMLENQQELILQGRRVNYCRNWVVDAVVMNKVKRAEADHIQTDIMIDLDEKTPIKSIDLCNLFSNILDNAIASCRSVNGGGHERAIQLTCGEKGGYLIIKCRNPNESAVSLTGQNLVQTTKDNASDHGFGLAIVEEIAAKYDGRCAISFDEAYFQITVFLSVTSIV